MHKTLAIIAGLALASPAARADMPNVCATPKLAGVIISELNDLLPPASKTIGLSVVDVTSITTVADGDKFACHVTAETSNGMRVPGTFSTFTNAAGDMIVKWKPDTARTAGRRL